MYKKLAIILLAANLVVAGLFINRHFQNINIQRDFLGQYIVAQHNISGYLNDAAGYYLGGNTEDFIINLHMPPVSSRRWTISYPPSRL